MSTTIDNKVVEMRFDNRHFESNVATTMSSLDKLKQKLNLSGATQGLEQVDSAARRIDMTGLGSAVDTVCSRFSALEVMGVTALMNITNSAVNAGKRMISALTIDPIKTGFSEYETKINAIQTIMSNTASKGTTMEDVTKVIGELNTYADKTIYNFAEMTRNIGTFTAAGIGLEESASAIQGIANLAAASGSTSQQASTAMYQLSQALSTGTVRLMDWNSVVNAGMGGELFQEALKASAREHGVAVDDIIAKQGSFRESLSEGWLTADILNTTLRKFTTGGAQEYAKSMIEAGKWTQAEADALLAQATSMEDAATKVKTFTQLWDTLKESAQSGWSQTWEIIVGDFEEAKETLTEFSKVIGEILETSANARNELLQGWKDAGGRAHLIDSLFNVFNGIRSIVAPIKEAFREIFPPLTVKQLTDFTTKLKELTAKFKLGEKASENLKRTFKGLFAIVDIVKQAFFAVAKGVASLLGGVGQLGGGILGVTGSFGDMLVKLSEIIKQSDIFNKIVQKIVGFIKAVAGGIAGFVAVITGKFDLTPMEALQNILERIKIRVEQVRNGFAKFKEGVADAVNSVKTYFENSGITKIFQAIGSFFKLVGTGISNMFKNLTDNASFKGFLDGLNALILGGVGVGLIKFLNSARKGSETLRDAWADVAEFFKNDFLGKFTGIFDGLTDTFKSLQQTLKANVLSKIAKAILLLTVSLVILSLIDSDKLAVSLGAITVMFSELMVGLSVFGKVTGKADSFLGVDNAVKSLVGVTLSVLLLSMALKKIASLSPEQMATGLAGVTGLITLMLITVKLLGDMGGKDSQAAIKGMGQMILMSIALLAMVGVLKLIATMGWNKLARGLTGVVVMAGVMVVLIKSMTMIKDGDFKTAIKGAGQMLIMATSLVIMAAALKIVASMSWEKLGMSLLGIAVAVGMMIGILKILSSPDANFTKGAANILLLSASLTILAVVLRIIGGMDWENLAKGLVGITVVLGVLVGALAILSLIGGGAAAGAASLLILVLAIGMLVPAIAILGTMSWGAIAVALVAIAGAFVILGVAGYALAPVAPIILMLAGAMALLGIAALAAGVGLIAIGSGLVALAAGFAAIGGSIGFIAKGIVTLVSALIVGIIKGIGEGIIAICELIAGSVGAITQALVAIIVALCDALLQSSSKIAETVLTLILKILTSLAEFTPKIIDALFDFLVGLVDGIANNLPRLIKAWVNLIMSLFQGVLDALGDVDMTTLIDGIKAVGLLTAITIALAAVAVLTPLAMVGVLGLGAVVTELAFVLAAIGGLAQIPGLKWLVEEGGDFMLSVGQAIGKFIGGIVGGIAEGVTASLPQMGTDLSAFMTNIQPFVEGAKSIDASAMEGVKSLADVILTLTAANILDGLTSWFTGGTSLVAFGEELAAFGPKFKQYADSVAGITPETVEASANAALALAEMASKLPNSGGVIGWFCGENSLSVFADELVAFGPKLKEYADSVAGITPESVEASINAASIISGFADNLPNSGGVVSWFAGDNTLSGFGNQLAKFGKSLKQYYDKISGIEMSKLSSSVTQLGKLIGLLKNIAGIDSNSVESFSKSLKSLAKSNVDKFIKTFEDAGDDAKKAIESLIDACVKSVEDNDDSLCEALTSMTKASADAIKALQNEFNTAGKHLVQGFANGITANTYLAVAKARAMARAAAQAAKAELDEHSPSKVGYEIGDFFGIAFVNAIGDNVSGAYDAGSDMAKSAKNGLSEAISKISSAIDGDMDMQPTIRPVLDLSDIESGAGRIGGLLSAGSSVGVLANVGSISSMMNHRNQNGNSDIVSELRALKNSMGNTTYSINGITYDDGSNIAEAVKTIARAAKVERRT